ncbi:MAG: hypothetical protein Q4E57_11345 [Eubacteriales bacterium]|nr:hypothetical protein [Eubacteriales bacterium]
MKKNIFKSLKFIMLTLTAVLAISFSAFASGFQKGAGGIWYENADGSYPRGQWMLIDGLWYYFNDAGYMATDSWIGDYYVGKDGAWVCNTVTEDGYVLGKDGKRIGMDGTAAASDTTASATAASATVALSGYYSIGKTQNVRMETSYGKLKVSGNYKEISNKKAPAALGQQTYEFNLSRNTVFLVGKNYTDKCFYVSLEEFIDYTGMYFGNEVYLTADNGTLASMRIGFE